MAERVSLDDLIDYVLKIVTEFKDEDNVVEIESDGSESVVTQKIDLVQGEMSDLSNLPEKLLDQVEACADEYYRYGVISKCRFGKSVVNVSLVYSILFCIDNRFLNIVDKEKQVYISKVIYHLLLEFDKQYKKHEYRKLGWTKKGLRAEIDTYTNSNIMVQYIADYFNINIFVLDWEDEVVRVAYTDNEFNKYKPSVILSLKSSVYEPIITNEVRFFSNKDLLIKTVINNPKIEILNPKRKTESFDKKFTIGMEDLDQYLAQQEEKDDTNKEQKESTDDEKGDEPDEEGEEGEEGNENDVKEKNEDDNYYDDSLQNENLETDTEIDETDNEEVEEEKRNVKDIFCKTKKSSPKKYKLTPSMKLGELQKIAKKLGIDINTEEKTKSGKFKAKTKSCLHKDISCFQGTN